MTNDEIRELAKKAGFRWGFIKEQGLMDGMIDFANLVAQQEREACAKLCGELSQEMPPVGEFAAKACAKFIRGQA